MLAEERHAKILDILSRTGAVKTIQLAQLLGTSTETVRKDLLQLDRTGQIRRVHGGAVSAGEHSAPAYISFSDREPVHVAAKTAIARRAVQMVSEGQCVGLDSGTSTFILAEELAAHFEHLTVVTNSLKNALVLSEKKDFTVILTGGVLKHDEFSLVSEFALSFFSRLNIDVTYMSVMGISPEAGFTDQRINEIQVQNAMRRVSQKVVVIADSSKFGRKSLMRICSISDVNCIITDESADPALVKAVKTAGTEVVIAPK